MQTLISDRLTRTCGRRFKAARRQLAPFTMDRRTNEVGTRNGLIENNSFYFLTSARRRAWATTGIGN